MTTTLTGPADPTTLEPLELRCEWRAAELGEQYVVTLTDEHRDELDAALRHARSVVTDVLDVTRADFPLPALAPVLTGVTEELVNGAGVVLLRGIDVARLGKDDATWIYWGIGAHVGHPWPQNAKGHLLGDVTDQGRGYDDPTARGNEIGGVPFPFHSDGSDLVGLLCLDAGATGGASVVANAVTIHNEMVRTEPELAAELYGTFPYDLRGEQPPGARSWYPMPAFTRRYDRLFVRYIRPYIESARRHPDAPVPSATARKAMDRLDAMCADPDHHVAMQLEPGDVQLVNNYHVLHARHAYTDDRERGRIRHLKRLWLETGLLTDDDKPAPLRMGVGGTSSWWSRHGRTKSDLTL